MRKEKSKNIVPENIAGLGFSNIKTLAGQITPDLYLNYPKTVKKFLKKYKP